ncbi:MAG: BspA family leucine-rich repeat surface protein [Lachnospiraceae bacterium]|nr:BspA family leucine-rich repeat surface protein [Lachnospiraceae bacterium]
MKKMRSVLAWTLVLAMLCGDINIVRAESVDGNDSVDETETADVSTADAEEINIAEEDVVFDGTDEPIAQGSSCGIDWIIDANGKLTVTGTYTEGDFNTFVVDEDTSCPAWCEYRERITAVSVSAKNVKSTNSWFFRFVKIESIDLSGFDTSKVTDMHAMFRGCSRLTRLDVSGFDTGKVCDMSEMFLGCGWLKSLDVSNFRTGNVTDMSHMFYGCQSLKTLDLSSFDTGKVTDMEEMFYNCNQMESLDVSHFDTRKVTNMADMFWNCKELENLDVSHFDTGKVTNMEYMFDRCSSLTSLDVSHFDTGNVTSMKWMFRECGGLTSLDVSFFDTANVTEMNVMFCGCSSLTSLNVSFFDTGNVKDIQGMFANCSSLESLDVSNFDTSKVIFMTSVFHNCSSLTRLDVSSFDTSAVNNRYDSGFEDMFSGCSGIREMKIFPSFRYDLELPVAPMYDAHGNSYTGFPKNLSEGIWLATDPQKVPVDPGRPTDITFHTTQEKLYVGQKKRLIYTFMPEDAVAKQIRVSSSDQTVATATLDKEGGYVEVTALAAGTTDITVIADGYTATCVVTVADTILLDYQDGKNTTRVIPVVYGEKLGALASLSPKRRGYSFVGWYTGPDGKGALVTADTVFTDQFVLYAYWKEDEAAKDSFTAELTEEQDIIYTGKAIKPAVRVYVGSTLLREKKDYSVSYKNNKNAYTYEEGQEGFDKRKAPTIIITGKGIYSGKVNLYFTIKPKNIAEDDVEAQELWLKYNGKEQKKAPVLTYNKKKMSAKTDIMCTYPSTSSEEGKTAYVSADDYIVHVEGKGNFTGERDVTLHIYNTKDAINLGKASVPKIAGKTYTGNAITLSDEELSRITVKVNGEVRTLKKDAEYIVVYKNNTGIGTATALISPVNGVSYGSKKITFKIAGVPIKTAVVTGIGDKIYNESAQVQSGLKVTMSGQDDGEAKELTEGIDYKVVYAKNVSAGTATLTIQGMGLYTGSIKKTFKILPYDLSLADGGASAASVGGVGNAEFFIAGESIGTVDDWSSDAGKPVVSVSYLKGGCRPAVQIEIGGRTLTEGTDYTVTYSNNKAVTTADIASNSKKMPTITIKGKGSYKGTVVKTFTIEPASIRNVVIYAPAKAASAKAGAYLSKPVLLDNDGKTLKEGTDYVVKGYTATYADGTTKELDKKSVVDQVGTVITVTVEGKGAYAGKASKSGSSGAGVSGADQATTSYKITAKPLIGVKVSAITKDYTGSAVELSAADFENADGSSKVTVKAGKEFKPLIYGTDFEIIKGTYTNNVKLGTASVKIRGLGEYGGVMTVKYKVGRKSLLGLIWGIF